jgi:hypothetical protein
MKHPNTMADEIVSKQSLELKSERPSNYLGWWGWNVFVKPEQASLLIQ